MQVTCKSQPGDIVNARHPHLGNKQTAIVTWVSPTKGTFEVMFADNVKGYEFPEHDGVWIQSEKSKNWKAAKPKGLDTPKPAPKQCWCGHDEGAHTDGLGRCHGTDPGNPTMPDGEPCDCEGFAYWPEESIA